MATTLASIALQVSIIADLSDALQGFTRSARFEKFIQHGNMSSVITSGTTSGKFDRVICDVARSIISTASEDIDVFDFAGLDANTDIIGNVVTMAELCGLLICNLSTSVGNLQIGGKGAATAFDSPFFAAAGFAYDSGLILPPNGVLLLSCLNDPAWAVVDSTNHLLKMAAPSGAVDYYAAFWGRSA